MIYAYASIDEVLGRIVRNTRVADNQYLLYSNEWIPEAMGYMRTKYALKDGWADVLIDFHAGKLPCGIDHIKAVEWNGQRLPEGNSSRTIDAPGPAQVYPVNGVTPFVSIPVATTTDNGNLQYNTPAVFQADKPCCTNSCDDCIALPCASGQYYIPGMGYIQTSFANGKIRVHYRALPLDKNGFPLIPDNEDYKEAIYWYVRGKMVGAGWKDPAYSIPYMDQKFELHAGRAMSSITYPSVDSMEMRVNALQRLLPDSNYFDNYFSTPYAERTYGDVDNYPGGSSLLYI